MEGSLFMEFVDGSVRESCDSSDALGRSWRSIGMLFWFLEIRSRWSNRLFRVV